MQCPEVPCSREEEGGDVFHLPHPVQGSDMVSPDAAQGFFLLKRKFFLPLLLVCRDNLDCNRRFINKVLNLIRLMEVQYIVCLNHLSTLASRAV